MALAQGTLDRHSGLEIVLPGLMSHVYKGLASSNSCQLHEQQPSVSVYHFPGQLQEPPRILYSGALRPTLRVMQKTVVGKARSCNVLLQNRSQNFLQHIRLPIRR